MILVDSATGSWEMEAIIRRFGVSCERTHLDFADACFEGNGPLGLVMVGIERKKLADVLDCIDTKRLAGHQLVGLRKQYKFSFLLIEGLWRPDTKSGLLLQGHIRPDADGSNRIFWTENLGGGRKAMYHKLRRYLFSVSMSGVSVIYTQDIVQTCYDIVELYQWFAKPWRAHKSMESMHTGYAGWNYETAKTDELMMIPTLDRKPTLVRRWAACIDGVGVTLSADAQRVFKTPLELANATELDWMDIPGMGLKSAKAIVKQIGGKS